MRLFLALGSFSAAIAVAAGAFGAHALRARVEPRMLEVWETAARYQMYHALALVMVGLLIARKEDAAVGAAAGASAGATGHAADARAFRFAGWAFVVGTLLFSGSLYAMTLTGVTAFGAITPVGGVCFIAGWVGLAGSVVGRR